MLASPGQGGVENETGVPQIEVTPKMISAGADRLWELTQAEVDLAYAAEEVFLAMAAAAMKDRVPAKCSP